MKTLAIARPSRRTTPVRHIDRAMIWLAIAGLLIGVRTVFYGVLMSPTLEALLGVTDADPLGPLPAHRIAVEDPLLIVAALGALAMATRHAMLHIRNRR